ncbi:MAG: hypothetical protein IJF37_09325 [Lachnospiraceae bacterium]|nr:hypothetical protein [Lachnospiraceae bacterium]
MSENSLNENDMIARYVYEVTKRVPQNMRKEIKLELETLIEDMREEEDCTVEQVLEKLGNPADFAKKYRDDSSYVIGPDYYDNYTWIVKIGLFAIGISAIVSGIVHGLAGAKEFKDFMQGFMEEGIISIVSGGCTMVGVVTIIFAVLEHKKVKVDIKPDTKWSPSALPAIPDKKSLISRTDSVINIVFIIVFTGVLVFVPEVFGVFEKTDDGIKSISCIFNLKEWNRIVPFVVFIFAVCIFDEIIKLIYGQYCKVVMYSSIICNAISLVSAFILLKYMNIWNTQFRDEVLSQMGRTEFSKGDILFYWGSDTFSNMIVSLIAIICCIEVAVTVYKTYKYGKH